MRIACIDRNATERLKLQQHIESAYDFCRSTLGHLAVADITPTSKDELLHSSAPDAVAVGPGFGIEESYSACREIKEKHPTVPLLIFLSEEAYSLRALRRFERVADQIFSPAESPTRLVHAICQLQERRQRRVQGKLLWIQGVKGGVGATSVTVGLAHAAEAIGKSAVVIDLSQTASLVHYMCPARWQSAEYAAALVDSLSADRSLVESSITTAPNGVNLLLPPAGGSDIRELWLREPKKFELTLSMVEILKEMFDVVLVDAGMAEGVLPFALSARAQGRLLVTSNDPASVHLLSRKLTEIRQLPGECPIYIMCDMLIEAGLTQDDIFDFLIVNKNFNEEMSRLRAVPFDAKGKSWIGTGNSFYTEASRTAQLSLEMCLTKLLNPDFKFSAETADIRGVLPRIRNLIERLPLKKYQQRLALKELPYAPQAEDSDEQLRPSRKAAEISPQIPAEELPEVELNFEMEYYEPPKLVVNR